MLKLHSISAFLVLGLTTLAGCYPSTPTPDYSIKVMQTSEGMVAIPPTCPSYATESADPYDNQPMPQFGCSNARNLALMVEQPQDLVDPRNLGPTRSVLMVGAMRRYDNNQTRGLIYTSSSVSSAVDVTTSPSAASSATGDVTGGPGQSSSSGSSISGAALSSSSTGSGAGAGAAAGP